MKIVRPLWFVGAFVLYGCAASDVRPEDIFPEDACAQCKMAFSDQAFASELIAGDGSIYKFDDIGCMERFKKKRSDIIVVKEFFKDYDSKKWISRDEGIVVQTSVKTPMGYGKVAIMDSSRAKEILAQYPPSSRDKPEEGCCGACSSSKDN